MGIKLQLIEKHWALMIAGGRCLDISMVCMLFLRFSGSRCD